METLAKKVRRLREERGLTTLEVESRSREGGEKGISNGYISKIENGVVTNLSTEKKRALAKGLGVSPSELEEEPDPNRITNERLARINFGYEGMPEDKKKLIDPLIDLLERETTRILNEDGE